MSEIISCRTYTRKLEKPQHQTGTLLAMMGHLKKSAVNGTKLRDQARVSVTVYDSGIGKKARATHRLLVRPTRLK